MIHLINFEGPSFGTDLEGSQYRIMTPNERERLLSESFLTDTIIEFENYKVQKDNLQELTEFMSELTHDQMLELATDTAKAIKDLKRTIQDMNYFQELLADYFDTLN